MGIIHIHTSNKSQYVDMERRVVLKYDNLGIPDLHIEISVDYDPKSNQMYVFHESTLVSYYTYIRPAQNLCNIDLITARGQIQGVNLQ